MEGSIEADETYSGGYRKGWNGRGAGKVGVAIAVERRGQRVFAGIVTCHDPAALLERKCDRSADQT